jgi:Fe2+ or Zn2+ uptake regulation protein
MNLALLHEKSLVTITTQVGKTVVDVQMSDKYVFFLCCDKKLKIFEIESGGLVREIEASADQIKLAPGGRIVLFDSINRIV